jgi:hypothetical protein
MLNTLETYKNNNSIDSFYFFRLHLNCSAYRKWARHTITIGQSDQQMASHTFFTMSRMLTEETWFIIFVT